MAGSATLRAPATHVARTRELCSSQECPDHTFVILEMREALGGTWDQAPTAPTAPAAPAASLHTALAHVDCDQRLAAGASRDPKHYMPRPTVPVPGRALRLAHDQLWIQLQPVHAIHPHR